MEELKYMQKIELSTGSVHEVTEPNQIRYLLIASYIAQNKDNWKKYIDNPIFYEESVNVVKEWCNMSDEEIKKKFPSLPFKK
jgi:hypothetical protein